MCGVHYSSENKDVIVSLGRVFIGRGSSLPVRCSLSLDRISRNNIFPLGGPIELDKTVSGASDLVELRTRVSFRFSTLYSHYKGPAIGACGMSISGSLTASVRNRSDSAVLLIPSVGLSISSFLCARIIIGLPLGRLYDRSYGNVYCGYNGGLGRNGYSYRSSSVSPHLTTLHRLLGGWCFSVGLEEY